MLDIYKIEEISKELDCLNIDYLDKDDDHDIDDIKKLMTQIESSLEILEQAKEVCTDFICGNEEIEVLGINFVRGL